MEEVDYIDQMCDGLKAAWHEFDKCTFCSSVDIGGWVGIDIFGVVCFTCKRTLKETYFGGVYENE